MRALGAVLLFTSLSELVLAQDATNNATSSPDFTLLAPTPSTTLPATDPITLRWAYTDNNLHTNPLTIEIGYTTSGTFEAHVTVNAAASLSSTTLPAGIIASVAPGETAGVGFVLDYRDGDDSEEVELGRVDGVILLGGEEEAVDEGDSKLSTEEKIGIGVGLGMGMSAAIFGVVFLIRRRRKRKRTKREKAAAAGEDQNDQEGSGNGGERDPVEMEAVERGHGKAELGAESEKVELDTGGQQKAELDSGEQVKTVRLTELEEKPVVTTRYELAG